MQNLFVNENDDFTVRFTVATNDKGTIFCDLNRNSLVESLGLDKNKLEIKDYKAVFARPSFGDSVKLYDSIFSTDGVNVNFNPVEARLRKIVALIKSWDLKGNNEKPTEADIRSLHPTIASAIGAMVDIETGGVFG